MHDVIDQQPVEKIKVSRELTNTLYKYLRSDLSIYIFSALLITRSRVRYFTRHTLIPYCTGYFFNANHMHQLILQNIYDNAGKIP